MSLNDQPESFLEIIDVSHAHGFSHQSRYTVAPLVVQAFDDTGFAASLAARPVLPRREPFGISFIEVAINQLAPIIGGQRKPQAHQAFGAAVTNGKADDLPCQARDCNPQVAKAPLEAKADHQLVDLYRIAFDGR